MKRLRLASLFHPLQTINSREFALLLALKTALAGWQIALTAVAFSIYDIPIPVRQVFAFMPLCILVSSLPITPGRLGTTQWSWVFFFGSLAPESSLVAFSLFLQVLLNLARWAIGAAVLPFLPRESEDREDLAVKDIEEP